MPEIHFTADHHFFHDGIIRMCRRPFSSTAEMNEVMVERWNAVVRPGDTVYHLGDFALKGTAEGIAEVFGRLRGWKYLVVGNHDKPRVRDLPWASPPQQRIFLRHPAEKAPMVLDHYAMRTWPSAHHGAVHLYGHSHGALPGIGRSLDVGVDCRDFRPVTLEELRPTLEQQAEEFERQREAARLFRERAARGDPGKALEILRRVPGAAPGPGDDLWDEMRNLRDGDYDQALAFGLRTGLLKRPSHE